MIPFLVKLAQILDDQGKHDIACEVDDLINKFVKSAQNAETLSGIVGKITQMANIQSKDPSDDYATSAQQLILALKGADYNYVSAYNKEAVARLIDALTDVAKAPSKQEAGQLWARVMNLASSIKDVAQKPVAHDNEQTLLATLSDLAQKAKLQSKSANVEDSKVAAHYYFSAIFRSGEYKQAGGNVRQSLDQLLKTLDFDGIAQKDVATRWNQIYSLAQVAMNQLAPQTGMASKTPKRRANVRILEAQKLLGVKPTGLWDATTNSKFMVLIQQHYPKYLRNGRFLGTLSNALELLKKIVGATEEDISGEDISIEEPAQVKSMPQSTQYRSDKYDLLDLQQEINRLVEKGKFSKEDVENLIGTATIMADKTRGNKQEAFERIFRQLGHRSIP